MREVVMNNISYISKVGSVKYGAMNRRGLVVLNEPGLRLMRRHYG
jgi:hypothetical protein